MSRKPISFINLVQINAIQSDKYIKLTHFYLNCSVDRTKLYSSLDQLVKMKMYTIVFSILHCVRTQQKFTDKKLLGSSLESTYYRKILKSALHQKEPQFFCKSLMFHWLFLRSVHFIFRSNSSTCGYIALRPAARSNVANVEGWAQIRFVEDELFGIGWKILRIEGWFIGS